MKLVPASVFAPRSAVGRPGPAGTPPRTPVAAPSTVPAADFFNCATMNDAVDRARRHTRSPCSCATRPADGSWP